MFSSVCISCLAAAWSDGLALIGIETDRKCALYMTMRWKKETMKCVFIFHLKISDLSYKNVYLVHIAPNFIL